MPIRLEFYADPLEVRRVLVAARDAWVRDGLDGDHCDVAEQVIAEALNNVVEHAQAGRPEGKITLETFNRAGFLDCTITDDGAPMPNGDLPKGELAHIGEELEHLPEGGFGWFLIRSLTERLCYNRDGNLNLLRFSIPA